MKTTKGLLLLCLSCLFLTAGAADDPIKGNGKLTTQNIPVADFNEIRIDGLMVFDYEQSEGGSAPVVEVTLDENLQSHLQVQVKNRVLTIAFKKGIKVEMEKPFTVKTRSPWLKEVRLAGNARFNANGVLSGDEMKIHANSNCLVELMQPVKVGLLELEVSKSANMELADVEAETVKCSMDGSGSIKVKKGVAKTGSYHITGSNDLHAFGLEVWQLTCNLAGNALAEVCAKEQLKVSILGNGVVNYKGNPILDKKILGKGTIKQIE
jgi:hypothetical protein